jgi:hypothetical protein
MWFVLEFIFWPILELFAYLYQADDRASARTFTVGCLLVFLVAMLIIGTAVLMR